MEGERENKRGMWNRVDRWTMSGQNDHVKLEYKKMWKRGQSVNKMCNNAEIWKKWNRESKGVDEWMK